MDGGRPRLPRKLYSPVQAVGAERTPSAQNKDIPVALVLPDAYKVGDTRYPVIHVLH